MTTRTSCWVNHGILLNDIYTRKNHPIEKTNHLPNLHFWGSKLISSQYLLRRPFVWCLVFRTTFSGDSWMYPYQCTPMGNPNISPSLNCCLWIPREHQLNTLGTLLAVHPSDKFLNLTIDAVRSSEQLRMKEMTCFFTSSLSSGTLQNTYKNNKHISSMYCIFTYIIGLIFMANVGI